MDADRARKVLADAYERADAPLGVGQRFHAANVRVMAKRDYADWKDRAALAAMLAYAAEREAQAHAAGRAEGLEEAAKVLDKRAAMRVRLHNENGHSINAYKACEAEDAATAIRARITTTGERP